MTAPPGMIRNAPVRDSVEGNLRQANCQEHGRDTSRRPSRIVPPTLLAIEAEAGVAYYDALLSDFAGVRATARVILHEWAGYRPHLIGTDVDESWREELDRRVVNLLMLSRTRRNRVDLARAANAVGGWVGEGICVYYGTAVPPAIIAMGHLVREINLDATACDLGAAGRHARLLRTAWMGLRPDVVMLAGGTRVERIDAELDAVALDIDRGDPLQVLDRAEALLEEVGFLESAFDD